MENNHQLGSFSNQNLPKNAVFNVGVEITQPNNLRYHPIEERELGAIVKDSSISIEKSVCIWSIGYVVGQFEKIHFLYTSSEISNFDKFLFFTIVAAITTAIITGIEWWRGASKLDKILNEIRARKVITLSSVNEQQNSATSTNPKESDSNYAPKIQ